MRLVVIESPYAGDVPANETYAKTCVLDSLGRGEAPIASHLLYTLPGVLHDLDPVERRIGIAAGHAWMRVAELVAVYTDRGISAGMQAGIDAAMLHGVPVEYRKIG